jgi:hypothetical protein
MTRPLYAFEPPSTILRLVPYLIFQLHPLSSPANLHTPLEDPLSACFSGRLTVCIS